MLLLGVIALIVAERRLGADKVDAGPAGYVIGAVALALGALYFAGALADDDYSWWPGLIGGVLCAALAVATARVFFRRTRSRLDRDAAAALPVYAEGAGVVDRRPVGAAAAAVAGRARVPRLAAARPAQTRGSEVRRSARPALT